MHEIENPKEFREKLVKQLVPIVSSESIATNVERGVYNFALKEADINKIVKKWDNSSFVQLYLDRLRTIWMNLKNPVFREKVCSGEITPERLAFITHQEMNAERWKQLIDQKIKRDANKYTKKLVASTDMYTCKNKNCRSKECTYFELQTRSADEPATIYVTCVKCENTWTIRS